VLEQWLRWQLTTALVYFLSSSSSSNGRGPCFCCRPSAQHRGELLLLVFLQGLLQECKL
jgi:hypothetical protein